MIDPGGFFHRLPYPLKAVGAGIRGYMLQRHRYGSETDLLVSQALDRESWGPARWNAWRVDRLGNILERARYSVPWYRRWWEERSDGGEAWRELRNWPVVTKEVLRADPRSFCVDGKREHALIHLHTSGSTGTPLSLWIDGASLRRWYALFEARWRGWNGVNRFDRWAILGGQRIVAADRKRPPFWVWNQPMRQLYLSAYHVAPWSVGGILGAMARYRVTYLVGYPSAMTELVKLAGESGMVCPVRLRFLLSNAEPLLPSQRELLESFFGCQVIDTYGMTEMVAGAGECAEGRMHLWPDAGIVEVLSEDGSGQPVADGEVGRLVCTGLINMTMPLIRYEVGDRGRLEGSRGPCHCGRTLPVLGGIEGRLDDLVITPDGRRLGRLDTAFKRDWPIRKAQIRQVDCVRLKVLVVPAEGYGSVIGGEIRAALQARVGGMEIEIEEVSDIAPGPNGKFRGVVSELPPEIWR